MDTALTFIPEISIIIPVFNVEDSIKRCLDSVFKQNVEFQIEVIAVDDGSVDKSIELLYEHKKEHPGLIIIEHTENQKLSKARDTGIKRATGKYVLHLDSDDWLLPGSLQRLHEISCKHNPEVIVFNYKNYNHDDVKLVSPISVEGFSSNREDLIRFFFGACWTKMVKRELLTDLIYGAVGVNSEEDLIYGIEIFLKAKQIYLLPDHLYAYISNHQSITGSVSSEKFLKGQSIVLNEMAQILKKYNAPQWTITRVWDYFDKFLYIELSKIHFWAPSKAPEITGNLLNEFKNVRLYYDRMHILNKAVGSKFYSLNQVRKRAGARLAVSIFLLSLKKNNLCAV